MLNIAFNEDIQLPIKVLTMFCCGILPLKPLPLRYIYHRSTFKYLPKLAILETAGFNVETVEYKNISFTVWDVGGQDKVRNSIRYFSFGHDTFYAMLGVASFLDV